MASYTPMMEQYRSIKQQHPNEILFFRLGDFYEMFFEDAQLAARELEITLTSREAGNNIRVPMCGIPYHAAENYIAKLIDKGYKIAICEQLEDPKIAKGIVKRDVIKIITPGTVLSESLLTDKNNNYLVLLYEENEELAISTADISTGECTWTIFSGPNKLSFFTDYLYCLMPAELVIASNISDIANITQFISDRIPRCVITNLTVDQASPLRELSLKHFSKEQLPAKHSAQIAVSYLLYYLHETVKADLSHINCLAEYNRSECLLIDAVTLRNLEITRNIRDGGKKDSLLSVLDFTSTAMGSRLLKKWLEAPLLNPTAISKRQDAVEELLNQAGIRQNVGLLLGNIYDFERILTRIEVGTANARDLIALKNSLTVLPQIKRYLESLTTPLLVTMQQNINTHSDITTLIQNAICEEPPFSIREGGFIKDGYHSELDELRNLTRNSKEWLLQFENNLKLDTGIKSLKVGFNKVFGYYIEITKSNLASVPDTFIRKQTLVNAERFITPELKEFEGKILGSQEKMVQLEYFLFNELRTQIKQAIAAIQNTAKYIAVLDVIVSLSEAAVRYNYIRPNINTSKEIHIAEGRHPVVERLLKREIFVPNDVILNHQDSEMMIITGPNMAGKSTYMRQAALLVVMAQIGSFIPAKAASICPVDRIFTRIGASDDLATGQSTFMVEMTEVAHILKEATANSLILLDEVGRGTSTFDGMSIARAVVEFIQDKIKAYTLFATHYHELTDLANHLAGVKNYSVAVKERGNEVVFLRRIIPGGADKSYGIHVAQLAGLPKKVVIRAQTILSELESNQTEVGRTDYSLVKAEAAACYEPQSLFRSALLEDIISLDVMTMTPLEALNLLYKLQNRAKQEAGIV